MDHRIPLVGAVLAIIAAIAAAATFIYLNEAFRGPSVSSLVSHPYELRATFDDVENLPTKSDVLDHGVPVGKVNEVSFDKANATGTVTFSVDSEYQPIYRDASARIGERTILGDAFLDLDRGHAETGELSSGGEIKGVPSVDFDEAIDFLDADGRAHLQSTLATVGEGMRAPGTGARLNGTIGGLSRTVEGLDAVTRALQGQEQDIAALTRDSSTVLGVLGDREQALRTIVGSGRRALDALGADSESVEQGVHELPGLLSSGERSLAAFRPLVREARPVVRDLRELAPKLSPALGQIGPLSGDAAGLIRGLQPFRAAATGLFKRTREALVASKPVVPQLAPGIRNLIPTLEYTEPRTNGITSFFSNSASAFAHGDSNGRWARFAMEVVPTELLGGPSPGCPLLGTCENAYPGPNDALNPQPYTPGSYTRMLPWQVPPRP